MSDEDFSQAISKAEWEGQNLAARALLENLAESVVDLAKLTIDAAHFFQLREQEQQGMLTEAEAAELGHMRDAIQAQTNELVSVVERAPEIVQAFLDYRHAVIDRADAASIAYLEGRATEGQLRDAHRDNGYLQGSILGTALPFLAAIHLPSGRSRLLDLSDRQSILEFLRTETLALRRAPGNVDWPVIENPGIEWGGAIMRQGDPWEDALEAVADLGIRTPRTFETFDFWDDVGKIATSAKTLNTQGLSPSRVYGRLKRYLDQVVGFESDNREGLFFNANEILESVRSSVYE